MSLFNRISRLIKSNISETTDNFTKNTSNYISDKDYEYNLDDSKLFDENEENFDEFKKNKQKKNEADSSGAGYDKEIDSTRIDE